MFRVKESVAKSLVGSFLSEFFIYEASDVAQARDQGSARKGPHSSKNGQSLAPIVKTLEEFKDLKSN